MTDTIFALSSGQAPSAIGIIRVSGPRAGTALTLLCEKMPHGISCLHDIDKDGYPNPTDKMDVCPDPAAAAAPRFGCPLDYIRESQSPGPDCNDADPIIKPGAIERCDNADWDCDGKQRNGCPAATPTLGAVTQSPTMGITSTTGGCGTQIYGSVSTSCSSGAAVGIGGFWGGPIPSPTQFNLNCNPGIISETAGTPEYSYAFTTNGPSNTSPTVGPGRADDAAGSANCDPGQFVVGINFTRSCLVDKVSIKCAPITFQRAGGTGPWTAMTGTVTTKYAGLGSPTSTHATIGDYTCPSGSVLTTLTQWHTTGSASDSNYVSGIRVGCRPVGSTPQQ